MAPGWSDQSAYDIRFDWGPSAIEALGGEIVVIVDVLRFTTAVEAAVGRDVVVHPYRWRDDTSATYATSLGAVLADGSEGGPSLSPVSLLQMDRGSRVVLPSPNGATCAAIAGEAGTTVVAACLRNAGAVAARLNLSTASVSVIACGERWPDGSLRPSLEDLLGAGAVIARLTGTRSPEAQMAAAAWLDARDGIAEVLSESSSGREQLQRGRADDLAYASQVDVSAAVPVLRDGAFVSAGSDAVVQRARLLASQAETNRQLASLDRDFEEIVQGSELVNTDDEHDPEGATVAFERAQVMALRASAQRRLEALDVALSHLDEGTYGVCVRCAGPIGAARLEAVPEAPTCVVCASGASEPEPDVVRSKGMGQR